MNASAQLLFLGLVAGAFMGWGACDLRFRALKDVVRKKYIEDKQEMQVEIDRARAQVARLIDTSSSVGVKANLDAGIKSSCCGDATHGCMING